jgi:hypothetical protein
LKALLQDRYADLLSTADEASGMLMSVRSLVDKVEELRSASKELISLAEKNERSLQSNSTTTSVATLEVGDDALGDNNKVINTTGESSLALYGSSNADRGQEGPLLLKLKKFEIERRIEAWLFSSFASIETFRMQQDHLTASLSVMFATLAPSIISSEQSFGSRILPDTRIRILKDAGRTIAAGLIANTNNLLLSDPRQEQQQLLDESRKGRRRDRQYNDGREEVMSNRFENVVNSVCSAIYAIAIIRSFSSSSRDQSVFLMDGSSHSYQRALHCAALFRFNNDATLAQELLPYFITPALSTSSSLFFHTPPLTNTRMAATRELCDRVRCDGGCPLAAYLPFVLDLKKVL